MKSVIFCLVFIGLSSAQYRPYSSTPGVLIRIVSQTQEGPNADGSYKWSYDTENGISAAEEGRLSGNLQSGAAVEAKGGFKYTAPDNTPISLTYIANENGFQPTGAHLPTPLPIPVAIQRALDWIRTNPDPRYQPEKYQGRF